MSPLCRRIGYQFGEGSNAFNTDMYGNVNIGSSLTVPTINNGGYLIRVPNISLGGNQFCTYGPNSLYTTHVSGHVQCGGTPTISATDTTVSVSRTSTGIYNITSTATTGIMNAVVSIADTTGAFFISNFASGKIVTVYIFNSSAIPSD
jgi:hypothetical protein